MPRPPYAHMMPGEIPLWDAFLAEHKEKYTGFVYDVHVGILPPLDPALPANIKAAAEAVYLYRIDAVGLREDSITIFEIKLHPGLTAYGQLLGYDQLYKLKYKPVLPIKLACVAEVLPPSAKYLFEQAGIEWYLYPPG